MRKVWMFMLTMMVVLSMAACGGSVGSNSSVGGAEISAVGDLDSSRSPDFGTFKKTEQIAETVLVDEDNVKITATELIYDTYTVDVELLLENNSEKDLSFVCGSSGYSCNSVNGYMIPDGYMYCNVAAGKKAYEAVGFSYDELMLYGITEIADIEIGFKIEDTNYNRTYTGPRQMKTSIAGTFDYNRPYFQESIKSPTAQKACNYSAEFFAADKLHDRDGISVLSEALIVNEYGELMLLLEIMNTTKGMVYIGIEDISVNGLVCYVPTWSLDAVNPGKRYIASIDLSSVLPETYWSALGIKNIDSVDLTLNIEDQDGIAVAAPANLSLRFSDGEAPDFSGAEIYNANGVRIISKGVFESVSNYDDLYVVLLIENNSGKRIWVDDVYDSLSVNGFMMEYLFADTEIDDGDCAVIEIDLYDTSLKKSKITSISDITEIEMGLSIVADNRKLDEPKIVITY